MRISDWSSDVCSSDLEPLNREGDKRLDGFDVGGIECLPCSRSSYFGRNGISSISGDIGHYHAGAFRRETTCRGSTDAARDAGHTRDLAPKSFHSLYPLSQLRLHQCHWEEWAGAIAL